MNFVVHVSCATCHMPCGARDTLGFMKFARVHVHGGVIVRAVFSSMWSKAINNSLRTKFALKRVDFVIREFI